jgi:hypothetical protein
MYKNKNKADTRPFFFLFFFLLTMESQKVIINITKNAKIRYFSRFSIAKIRPKFKKTRHISNTWVQVGVAKIKEGFYFLMTFIFSL